MANYKKRKDGRYEAKVTIGKKPDGSLERVTLYANSQKELSNKVSDLKYKHSHNLSVKSPNMLMSDYSRKWLDTYASSRSISTNAMYKNIIENI